MDRYIQSNNGKGDGIATLEVELADHKHNDTTDNQ